MPAKRKAPASTSNDPPKARPSKLAKENDITAAQENEIKEAYTLFSTPHVSHPKEGVLPTTSIRRALIALDIPPRTPSQLTEFLEILDPDKEGYTTYANFVAICALQMHNRSEGDRDGGEEVRHAFGLFLGKGKGKGSGEGGGEGKEEVITIGHLRRIARELKEEVDDEVLKDMILEANGGAGMAVGVRREEFEGVMKRAGVFR